MEKFTIGLTVGALLGAAVVANSQKTRRLFIKSQEDIKSKIDDMIDEKMENLNDDYQEDEEDEPISRKFKKRKE